MNNIIRFPGDLPPDGGGPEDPMLEQRVSNLEQRLERIENILVRLEPDIRDFARNGAKQADLHKAQLELSEIKGKLSALPTWWMLLITVLATWGAGAGIVYSLISKVR
jgi:hypothetical protein